MGEGHGECGDGGSNEYGPWVWTAYKAYNELLREKLKKKFEATEGPRMDQLAGLLVELVNARWDGGRQSEKAENDIREKIDKLLQA
ncbi:MAG: hypothetical protein L3J86_03415 [Thermoplasmata archaeon]|nr:hypothetical protein [Thermoplasmata archaeon]